MTIKNIEKLPVTLTLPWGKLEIVSAPKKLRSMENMPNRALVIVNTVTAERDLIHMNVKFDADKMNVLDPNMRNQRLGEELQKLIIKVYGPDITIQGVSTSSTIPADIIQEEYRGLGGMIHLQHQYSPIAGLGNAQYARNLHDRPTGMSQSGYSLSFDLAQNVRFGSNEIIDDKPIELSSNGYMYKSPGNVTGTATIDGIKHNFYVTSSNPQNGFGFHLFDPKWLAEEIVEKAYAFFPFLKTNGFTIDSIVLPKDHSDAVPSYWPTQSFRVARGYEGSF